MCIRDSYKQAIRTQLDNQKNLALLQQTVDDLLISDKTVCGVVTNGGIRVRGTSVVLTVGTFLGGRIHVGLESQAGGRAGEPAANRLAERL